MQLKYLQTLIDGQDQINRVAALAWSPNNQKLAVATADRHVLIFDENGERRDKFSTKPSTPGNGKNSYLAIAQSDCIVFVYKFGDSWNDKKVICNKFVQPTAVTTLIWLSSGPIIAGLDNGKVRALHCKTNKSQTLYNGESLTISLSSNSKGNGFLSGHDDGTVIRFYVSDEGAEASGKLLQHHVPPIALAWPQGGVAVGGCDKKIYFYDNQGRQVKVFDYSRSDIERDLNIASSSPNGQAVAFGGFDRVRIYSWSPRLSAWSESVMKEIENIYTVSALTWRKDGSRLALGSVSGAVVLFESVLRRTIWQDKFELIFVAPSQLLVKSLQEPSEQMIIQSKLGLEIDDVRIMGKDNYLLARTEDSLILCDLTRNLISEVP
uniref:Anaphase-promoting complex subunit 4 WD40 domain-containing protein n=1 Tax=Megaselia scalaris TaxID=36166 RepID=T1GRP5_MEGSC